MSETDLPADRARAREALSALMDGDCDRDQVAQACRLWRQDAQAREQWHAFHVIGDVLRSDDLAQQAHKDAAFMQSLRVRLAQEPVVLAPMARPADDHHLRQDYAALDAAPAVANSDIAPAGSPRRSFMHLRRWTTPVGMAAGVALVAGAVLVTRPGGLPGAGENTLATATTSRTDSARSTRVTPPRIDPELVRYLDAHQQFPGTTALNGPTPVLLRSASYESAASQ